MASNELRNRHPQKPGQDRAADEHPAGPVKHGQAQQTLRMILFGIYFMSCCILICTTQVIGSPLYYYDKAKFYRYMAWTKEHFALVLVFMTNLWCPTVMKVYGDDSVRGQIKKNKDGLLETSFSDRMVMIANHQIYTDWIYLWWIAYANKLHGHIYIMLKRSLQFIPIIGQGMMFYNFIFMDRKWANDEKRIKHRLDQLNSQKVKGDKKAAPMWFLLFPEGTNLSNNGRRRSKEWAEKSNDHDMVHQLLPRSKGLLFSLQQLRETVDWVYDCTMAYEGVPPGEYGQDIFTLKSTYFQGRPPRSVSLHWRRFPMSSIPLVPLNSTPAAEKALEDRFHNWLLDRWREKDALMDRYMTQGSFQAGDGSDVEKFLAKTPARSPEGYLWKTFEPRDMEVVETAVRPKAPYEFLQIVAVPGLAIGVFWKATSFVRGLFRS